MRKGIKTLLFITILFYSIMSAAPFIWLFMQSLKSETEFLTNIWGFPKELAWDNYRVAWIESKFFNYFSNSVIYTVVSTVVIIFLSLMAGFAFSKLKFFGKEFFYYLIIANLLIPTAMLLLPIFFLIRDLGIRNTIFSMVFPYFTGSVPICVILARNYFDGIPDSLIEAGKIDGHSIFSIFMRIMMPLSGPITATLGIITAMAIWNDYLWALVAISDKTKYTVSIGLTLLNSSRGVFGNTVVFAAIIINCLVIVLIYLIFQKQFIKSVTQGAVKE